MRALWLLLGSLSICISISTSKPPLGNVQDTDLEPRIVNMENKAVDMEESLEMKFNKINQSIGLLERQLDDKTDKLAEALAEAQKYFIRLENRYISAQIYTERMVTRHDEAVQRLSKLEQETENLKTIVLNLQSSKQNETLTQSNVTNSQNERIESNGLQTENITEVITSTIHQLLKLLVIFREHNSMAEDCTTPFGISGKCVPIMNCPELVKLHRGTANDLRLVQQSQCGFNGSTPLVCCLQIPAIVTDVPESHTGIVTDVPEPHVAIVTDVPEPHVAIVTDVSEPHTGIVTDVPEPHVAIVTDVPEPRTRKPQPLVSENKTDQLPSPDNCGFSAFFKISGGLTASLGAWPWTALMFYERSGNEIGYGCGGSLINHRYVLTAAHCVKPELSEGAVLTMVRLGEHDVLEEPDAEITTDGVRTAPHPQNFEPEQIIIHPDFNIDQNNVVWNDIALVRLNRLVEFTDFVRPICLPNLSTDLSTIQDAYIVGWGALGPGQSSSDVLQQVSLPLVETDLCSLGYSTSRTTIKLDPHVHVCAGGERGKDSCRGDSGGPLQVGTPTGQFYQIGVLSFGAKRCGATGTPGVYSNVTSYRQWILDNIKP